MISYNGKFRDENAQIQPKFTNLSTAMEQAILQAIFCLDMAKKLQFAWHNKCLAKIIIPKDYNIIKK